jgi:hypothetical protein
MTYLVVSQAPREGILNVGSCLGSVVSTNIGGKALLTKKLLRAGADGVTKVASSGAQAVSACQGLGISWPQSR